MARSSRVLLAGAARGAAGAATGGHAGDARGACGLRHRRPCTRTWTPEAMHEHADSVPCPRSAPSCSSPLSLGAVGLGHGHMEARHGAWRHRRARPSSSRHGLGRGHGGDVQGGADVAGVDLEVGATSSAWMADLEIAWVDTAGEPGAAAAWGDMQGGAWSGGGASPGWRPGLSPRSRFSLSSFPLYRGIPRGRSYIFFSCGSGYGVTTVPPCRLITVRLASRDGQQQQGRRSMRAPREEMDLFREQSVVNTRHVPPVTPCRDHRLSSAPHLLSSTSNPNH
ncbi:unnamed protein product [Miscanthus lutarioriparius]|uniref:Uncharacterized protein n=1 Tax=Miscanthus lutarioriparius TaxID=422564 RepID=A0A811NNJ9_9POAL|nr:unnamed protein product [Miscanthus lutarioriparius]